MLAKPIVGVAEEDARNRVVMLLTNEGFPRCGEYFPGNETQQTLALGLMFPRKLSPLKERTAGLSFRMKCSVLVS